MTLFFVRFVAFAFGSGVFAQDPDYGTTPFPLPLTSFTCHGRLPGYYADVETGCRTYHLCEGSSQFTYFCPRRTLFQQRTGPATIGTSCAAERGRGCCQERRILAWGRWQKRVN